MSEEEKEAIEYFEHKIKNKLPLYEETYVDGKPYRRNILQLETNFTEEQADKTEILLNLIDKLQKDNKELKENSISKDIIRDKIKELEEEQEKPVIKNKTSALYHNNEQVIDVLNELLGE